ncbi:MAG: Flp pilus assembly protein CpaB [Acidobacteria bacterium]|nr:Flp pilus assembly protein CpaB [Acidobacteriota bacterium]MBI3423680.1 Flp pilus assembly protein CpaB [Acidobacteriota bacterium]
MKNKALVLVLAGAVVFGLLAAMSVSKYTSSNAQVGDMTNMVVARVEVPLGTQLNQDQLTVVQVPKTAAPEQSFTKTEDLIGRVAINAIGPKEPLTEFRLAPKGSLSGLAALVPEGYRAITVRVDDEAGVAGLLAPGMLVDLISVVTPPDGAQMGPISKIVLQNVKVLATGQNMALPKEQVEATRVNSVTLLVTPQEAEKVMLASYDARLRMIVRNYIDNKSVDTTGITKRSVLSGDFVQPIPSAAAADTQAARPQADYAPRRPRAYTGGANWYESLPKEKPAVPAATPKPVNQIEVFDGKKKSTVEFPQDQQ